MTDSKDPKERFREALAKKRATENPRGKNSEGKPKVRGGQSNSGGPKMFRRKSGPS
jgi:hypothetical protein